MTRSAKTTKRTQLLQLLCRKGGATSDQLCARLGWRPHSVRAAISGLRKDGQAVERLAAEKPGGVTRWRVGAPAAVE